jgi:hypothetical protein
MQKLYFSVEYNLDTAKPSSLESRLQRWRPIERDSLRKSICFVLDQTQRIALVSYVDRQSRVITQGQIARDEKRSKGV